MKWSWKLAEVSGIPIYVHATFLLIIGWVVLTHGLQGLGLGSILSGVFFVLIIFACVVLHELGHALMAKRYGILTRDITLLPIGGVARLERMPDKPLQEFWVALAGPAVNLVIAVVLFFWLQLTNSLEPLERLSVTGGPFLERIMAVNIFLLAFNLLPAFPMDGGRILRALLATRVTYVTATRLAATVGQGMALLFGFLGLFTNPFLIFIALFVWIGAGQEASVVEAKSAVGGITVRSATITDFRSLRPSDHLDEAVHLILSGYQQDFPVVDSEAVVGILTRAKLLRALAGQEADARVEDIMDREITTIEASEPLAVVFERFNACACPILPVLDQGRLFGLVTPENVGEFIAIRGALSHGADTAVAHELLRS